MPPNGSRLSCGRKARGRAGLWTGDRVRSGSQMEFYTTWRRPTASSAVRRLHTPSPSLFLGRWSAHPGISDRGALSLPIRGKISKRVQSRVALEDMALTDDPIVLRGLGVLPTAQKTPIATRSGDEQHGPRRVEDVHADVCLVVVRRGIRHEWSRTVTSSA